ncbi:hypothetical protein [Marinomonas flavescens]|uniref:hypothetical protein n=1 Tax=Marinomonas flavescens TaxID=2529379 RepID=UPI0010548E58|nr:hypothetical protein [Marinomonas flavescens]
MKFSFKLLLLCLFFIGFDPAKAQQNLGKSHVAMAYVCWHLANGSEKEEDSNLFAKMISVLRRSSGFKAEQHYEYMGYAAQEVLKLNKRQREEMYQHACLKPLDNIKRAERQGMLN